MILAAGMSPAWQRIMQFNAVRVGQVNRAATVAECASGKVINVGLAARRLNADVHVLTCGGGATGRWIADDLLAAGCRCTILPTASSTRTCTTVLDMATGEVTELVENAREITGDEMVAFRNGFTAQAASAALLVLSGSLPQGSDANFFRDLLAPWSDTPAVLDIRGPELVAALTCRPLLVKPNREELGHTVGRQLTTTAEMLTAVSEIVQRGAQWVCVSQGEQATLLSNGREHYELRPPRVATVNPIGCGDCLTAGIAVGLSRGNPVVDAVRLGMAAAAANAARLLPADFTADDVQGLLDQVAVRSLNVE